jgi:hypothetical protein
MIPRHAKSKQQAELRSQCATGKRRFKTLELAERALGHDAAWREEGNIARQEIRAYQCTGSFGCGGFHLSSKTYYLPAQSDKRIKEQRERSAMLLKEFGRDPLCARCGKPADDAHELLSRARGGSITDPTGIRPMCRGCHDFITTNPDRARSEGWALSAEPKDSA